MNDSIAFQRRDTAGNDTKSLERQENTVIGPQSDSKLLRPLTKMGIGVHAVGVGMISRLRDSMPKRRMRLDPELAAEAKSIVALAFRNGPIEDVHAGKECTACRILPYNANRDEEHHETVRGHGLQVALAETE